MENEDAARSLRRRPNLARCRLGPCSPHAFRVRIRTAHACCTRGWKDPVTRLRPLMQANGSVFERRSRCGSCLFRALDPFATPWQGHQGLLVCMWVYPVRPGFSVAQGWASCCAMVYRESCIHLAMRIHCMVAPDPAIPSFGQVDQVWPRLSFHRPLQREDSRFHPATRRVISNTDRRDASTYVLLEH